LNISNNSFRSGCFIDSQTGWAISNGYGIIYKTTNSGINWNIQLSSSSSYFESVRFLNSQTGWAAGEYGNICCTTNGGTNWNLQNSLTNRSLFSVYFTDSITGWIVGDYGTILKTTNGGISSFVSQINQTVPEKFSLMQNYPNPFNPSTLIKFNVPVDSRIRGNDKVLLKIYDILGKEIETLVNEKLQPGSYSVEWNASQYPSGVYFYSLVAGEFRESRKMILLK
jgi:photosystem II stability/assembly factor-like uncharacterized protein